MKSNLGKCEVCGSTENLCRAHIIHDGDYSYKNNIMCLCRRHHYAFDSTMDRLLNRPFYRDFEEKRKSDYAKEYVKQKQLYYMTIIPYLHHYVGIKYYINTDNFTIDHGVRWRKQKKGERKTKSLFNSSFGEPYVVIYDSLTYNKTNENVYISHGFTFQKRGG